MTPLEFIGFAFVLTLVVMFALVISIAICEWISDRFDIL